MDSKKTHQGKRDSENTADASKLIAELQARETRLTAFFEGAPVPTFVLDENHQVRRWNRALEILSGIPAREMLGTKNHWQAFYPKERPCLADLLLEGDPALFVRWYEEQKIQPGLIDEAMEATDFFPNLGKNGKWLRFTAAVIRSAGGAVLGAVETLEDITARKQAEAALRDKEAKYRFLLENSNDIIWTFDLAAMAYTYCSKSVERLLGYSTSEVVGMTLDDIFSPETRDALASAFAAVAMKTDTADRILMDAPHIAKDGRTVWMEINAVVQRNAAGDAVAFTGVTRDITERRQAAEQLRRSEEKYRRIADNISDVVWMMDMDLNLVYVSPSAERMVGEPVAAQIKRPMEERFPPESLDIMATIFAEELEKEKDPARDRNRNRIAEVRHFRADGSIIWVAINMSFVRDDTGRVVGILGVTRDITDRKTAEDALRESEARFRLFSQMAPVGVVIEDHAEKNLYVSQKFTKMLGYTRDDIPSAKDWWPLAYPDAVLREKIRREWSAEVAKAKKTNFEINPFEATVTCKNGSVKDIEFRMRIADRLNFITLTDITDRKQAEAERDKLHAQLIQAQKMESVGRLAGGVAHDFNNMLSVILGHAELAMDQTDQTHFLYEDLREIYQAAERSADLTRQLLAFARKQTISPRIMDLNETVEGMLRMLRRLIGEDVDLVWEPEAQVWPVKMDPSQVDQILANLCVNAKDALPGGGKIVIETTTRTLDAAYCHDHAGFLPGDYVVLAVSDNGCGMSPDIQANLFEPFYTTKEVGRGTGLGLATIYGIVKQNNGFINVYSEPGTGTTFRIYIPRHEREAAAESRIPPAPVEMRGTETILLVEDEAAILKMTRSMLKNMGYRVLTADNPATAIRMSETLTETVHLLLTDVVMPGMNGRELAERLVRLWPELKVLYISGYTANAIAHFGVLNKGLNFIQKPFSAKDLHMGVRKALEGEGGGVI